MNRTLLTSAVCTLAGALIASADVPSLINYQGRLTDANGAPVTGSKTFAISIYDAATAGNLLYSESIGAVTLDSNGVYSFQFGNSGTSNTQVTETIGTTAGSTLTYTKTLSNTPVVANSITVTDGTNSWSQAVGNPGTGATATANTISGFVIGATITNGGSGYTSAPAVTITGSGSGAAATATISGGVVTGITITSAGSGYTGGATITIAPPVIPFRVDYSGGAITATYSSAPTAGRTISANYRYGTNGISAALSGGAEHWMAISVDGVTQGTRQRVLAVPFAQKASVADSAISAPVAEQIAANAQDLAEHAAFAAEMAKAKISSNQTSQSWSEFFVDQDGFYNTITSSDLYGSNYPVASEVVFHSGGNNEQREYSLNKNLRYIQFKTTSQASSQFSPSSNVSGVIYYADGATQTFGQSQGYGWYSSGQSVTIYIKPEKPSVTVSRIQLATGWTSGILTEVSIWLNSSRTLECSLPQGYINPDFEYKPVVSFSQQESGAAYGFSLVDSGGSAMDINNEWSVLPQNVASAVKIRLRIAPPLTSTSETQSTRPIGIVLLKRRR
jgi:hypothetical protein